MRLVHFIGIGGIGMSALARILLERGYTVSGSDIKQTPITEKLFCDGATIFIGQAESQVPRDALVVYSSDISSQNVEFLAAQKKGCSLIHRSDLLAQLTEGYKTLAVAGTHGKTTTSSLLTAVLHEAQLSPSFAIGGILHEFESNSGSGKGPYFVIEADESDRSFLKYSPFGAICTNIDNDHLVNYNNDLSLLVSHFNEFLSKVESPNCLLWCRDNEFLNSLDLKGYSFGFHPQSDWKIINLVQKGFSITYDLIFKNKEFKEITLNLAGHHNALNSAAVFALCTLLKIEEISIRHAFSKFRGVARRCENKGSFKDIDFIDDYAHHPTEIETTLKGIRRAIGNRRLITVFQPHRFSRVKDCQGQYGQIFDSTDLLIITDVYSAGESPIPGITPELIEKEVRTHSTVPCQCIKRCELKNYLADKVRENDVVVTLGAGDITSLSRETLNLLHIHE